MSVDAKSVPNGDGQISYHETGSGAPLLMLHGSGPGVKAWMNFGGNFPVFGAHFRCIAPDLPGYGASSPVEGSDPVAGAIGAVLSLMDQLGIRRANFIGNSYGAIVASRLAALHPERVERLVAIGGIGVPVYSPFPYEGIERAVEFVENPTRQSISAWLRSMVYDPAIVTDELIDMRLAEATSAGAIESNKRMYSRAGIEAIAAARRGPDAVQDFAYLPKIEAPTLITWGRDDRVNPVESAMLPMRLIPNSELHVFSKCGHWAMIEQKAAFEQVVLGFLTRD